jgi:hypothetical protein
VATVATLREHRKGKNNILSGEIKEGASENIVKESLTDRTNAECPSCESRRFCLSAYNQLLRTKPGFCIGCPASNHIVGQC